MVVLVEVYIKKKVGTPTYSIHKFLYGSNIYLRGQKDFTENKSYGRII